MKTLNQKLTKESLKKFAMLPTFFQQEIEKTAKQEKEPLYGLDTFVEICFNAAKVAEFCKTSQRVRMLYKADYKVRTNKIPSLRKTFLCDRPLALVPNFALAFLAKTEEENSNLKNLWMNITSFTIFFKPALKN